jgi:hypothetical protein
LKSLQALNSDCTSNRIGAKHCNPLADPGVILSAQLVFDLLTHPAPRTGPHSKNIENFENACWHRHCSSANAPVV